MKATVRHILRLARITLVSFSILMCGAFGWYLQPLVSADVEYERLRELSIQATTKKSHPKCETLDSKDAPALHTGLRPSDALIANYREIDWAMLGAINQDIIGWIYAPNTPIDYPVVQAPANDEEKYLRTTFEGHVAFPNNQGTIYLDEDNARDGFSSISPVIYGHYQLNGSMFSSFSNNDDPVVLAGQNQVFIYTPSAMFHVELFAGNIVDASTETIRTSFSNQEDLNTWLESKLDESEAVLYRPRAIEQLFTFVTCSYSRWKDQRTLSYGRVVDSASQELIAYYSSAAPSSTG